MVRTFSYAWIDHKLSLLDKFAKVSLVTFFEIIMLFAPLCGMSKRSKRGQKSKLSKSRFIFQRLARTEATAKILGPWDQKWVQESPK